MPTLMTSIWGLISGLFMAAALLWFVILPITGALYCLGVI